MTGLIFVVIALAWIAYLVPSAVARREGIDVDLDPLDGFGEGAHIVAPSAIALEGEAEVSTPLMRRAARAEIRDTARRAARRRRIVALTLLGLVMVAGLGSVLGAVVWWTPLVPAGLLVGFLGVARFSVVQLNRRLDERLAELEPDWHEDTISFQVPAGLRVPMGTNSTELSIEISAPVEGLTGSLWDPIPVTVPTYVSKPMVPRTVRTIDLSGPDLRTQQQPVVAEPPQRDEQEQERGPRAVGE